MWPYRLSLEITTYSSLILGIFVFLQNRRIKINRVFFIFSILVAIYVFFLKESGLSNSPEEALFFSRFMYIGVISIPVVYYHLTLLMTGAKSKLLYFFYASTFFFFSILFNPIFIAGTRYFETYKIYSLRPGILYYPFLVFFYGVLSYSLLTAIKKYKSSHSLKKTQLRYFIYGSGIGFLGGTIDYLPKFGIFFHPLNTYCNYLITIYIISFAYAILKYRLMDINIIIKKGLVYSTIIAIFTGFYLSTVYIISQLFRNLLGIESLGIVAAMLFIFALFFQPLKNRITRIIDKLFFKSSYEYQVALRNISKKIATAANLQELNKLTSQEIKEILKTKEVRIQTFL